MTTKLEVSVPEDRISVSFSVSDNYVQHMAVLVASLLDHSPQASFVFHVLSRSISDENRKALHQMEIDYAPRCTFDICLVDKAKFDKFPLPIEHITQEMYYRFLLPNLLTYEKRTIYMDVDIIAMNDITPLWKYDLKGACMAGVAEVKSEGFTHYKVKLGMRPESDYFNSGVLVMNLEKLREMDFETKCMSLTAEMHDRIAWPDQDVINLVLEGKICSLPRCYNCMSPKLMKNKNEIVLRHYASFSSKPWCYLWKNQSWYSYLKYLRKTPFKKNAWGLIWAHIKGFFWYTYTKKGVQRTLCMGILVHKKKV